MKIKYSVSTMVFWGRENPLSFEQECQFLKSMGLGIELWPNIKNDSRCRYCKDNWQRLSEATEGMTISMQSRNDFPNLDQWQEQIECAKLLNANIVANLKSLRIPEYPEKNNYQFAEKITKFAEEKNVEICIETGSLQALKEIGKKFESIHFCLDMGHANLDKEVSFKKYVDELAHKVTHLHLTDNYGQIDDHEPPGLRGGISKENWNYLLDTLKEYDHTIIGSFEMNPCMPSVMIRQACEFLFGQLQWPNPPYQEYTLSHHYPIFEKN